MSAGQEIRGELDAIELGLHRRGERAHGERLGQARNAFEQHVAVGQQPDQQALDQLFLADDDVGDFLPQRFNPSRRLADLFFDRLIHVARI